MSNRPIILKHLHTHGPQTYEQLESTTQFKRPKLLQVINDAKNSGHVDRNIDKVTRLPVFNINQAGIKWLVKHGHLEERPVETAADLAIRLSQPARATMDEEDPNNSVSVTPGTGGDITVPAETTCSPSGSSDLPTTGSAVGDKPAADSADVVTATTTEPALSDVLIGGGFEGQKYIRPGWLKADELAAWQQLARRFAVSTPAEMAALLEKAQEAKGAMTEPIGYLVATPNKPLRRFAKSHNADRIAAAAAKRSGLAEVFAIYPLKKAVRGVEWK